MNQKDSPDLGQQPETAKPATRWGQERRLEFIDFRLRWDGRLNRSDLTAFFGISVPQASLDLSRYIELAPGNLVYDRSARIYVASPEFRPLFASSNSSRYLNELLACVAGILESEASFIGWWPPIAAVPVPGRVLDAHTLTTILRAIREHSAVEALYQSMSRPEASLRVLTPHALAHDGFRWHVRAFCHTRQAFRDFVIARILEVRPKDATGPAPSLDTAWDTVVKLTLAPNPGLSKAHRRVIELDYSMRNGEVELECRQALLFYVLQHLGLNQAGMQRPESQQIVLKNWKDIEKYLVESQVGAKVG